MAFQHENNTTTVRFSIEAACPLLQFQRLAGIITAGWTRARARAMHAHAQLQKEVAHAV